ncbi:MAG: DNA topoisomerase IB [Thermoleophilaceae bacterium]|nr:DNA topoisomerase IB [Thermoleophilaceae bacterium]
MARLRRVDCAAPGIARRRRGRGFEYRDEHGERIADPEVVARIQALAIPPAWKDVWVCAYPMGHIQATGTDAAGRKQYRYHDQWRQRRDAEKFDEMIGFARSLPRLRKRVARDLGGDDLGDQRVLACATRLLDRGFFRVGSEGYAADNDTYGLATIRKQHVTISGDTMVFDYAAKGKKRRVQRLSDPEVVGIVDSLKRRRSGGDELLAYKRGRRWVDVKSADVNAYLKDATGGDFSAKNFRTWNATVLAALALAASGPAATGSKTARKRAQKRAVDEVSRYLGNTPAVCRASYIDPRVFDRFDGGLTIGGVFPDLVEGEGGWPEIQPEIEQGVLDLIHEDEESGRLEKVA